ncbi:MAG: NAD(P)-dependent oxidoreductase [Rhodospirillales bacterium]|nr:NAD(P)-dependent oxidoreductase [Rhodospirillales bacterium]
MAELDGWKIGFIGLGLMGKPMARNLAKAGATLFIHNRSRAVVDELAGEGMVACGSAADVARQAQATLLMLTDTAAVEMVMNGPDGVLAGLKVGDLVIDMSTSKVPVTRALAAATVEKGGAYVDAPVSGGTMGAKAGTLTIMAGGTVSAIDCARPLFDVLGSKLTHVGDVGCGQIAKAANQMIVGLNIGAVAEALTLAKRAGADPALVRQAIQGGFADSKILDVHGQRMLDGDFTPGAHCTVQRKDMDQAVELAQSLGLELPATSLNRDLYDRVIKAGHGRLDHAALIKAIEGEG